MSEPVFGGGAAARPGSVEGGRQITVNAQDEYERAVEDMRTQFLTVSGQIADELIRLQQHVAAASPNVRDRVVHAVLQIASMQQNLRNEVELLPSDPQDRYAIMASALQAQQGALHQLAIIVRQYAPGWYPNLAHTAAWHPSVPNGSPQWSPSQPAAPEEEANAQNGATSWYPSPPTVQDLATRDWPPTHRNGYANGMPQANAQPGWPMGTHQMVPYAGGGASEASQAHGIWPARRSYAAHSRPAHQYEPRELRPARSYGQTLPARRRSTELVTTYGAGSNNLLWVGIGVLALIFAYLSFYPWEIRRRDAVADARIASPAPEAPASPPAAQQPTRMPPTQMPPTQMPPTQIVSTRVPDAEPSPPPPSLPPGSVVTGMALPTGFVGESPPAIIIGTAMPGGSPFIDRDPAPVETPAAAPVESTLLPAARPRQRAAPSRAEPEPVAPAAAEAAPRAERFVAVVFTHRNQSALSQAFSDLQLQYPNLLASRQGETQRIDRGDKGVWHRLVVLPPGSRQDADALCGQLAGVGYERCWVKPY